MALLPMQVEPGELLTTTENEEDVDYNQLWCVPDEEFQGVALGYGDLLLVIASWELHAVLLHLRTGSLFHVDDIAEIGWLFRPDPSVVIPVAH